MRNWLKFLTLLMFVFVLGACQNEETTPTATEVAQVETVTTPVTEPTLTAPPPTATSAPTATSEPTATPTPAYEPVFETESCEFQVPPGRDVECGWLTVPEDRGNPEKMIHLHVAIFHSDNPNPAPDPIVYLEGGPGGDALEAVPLVFEMRFAPFLANHDLIMFDQRGTGYSEPSLACPEETEAGFALLEQDISPEQATEQLLDALFACQERLLAEGINLAAYNSRENAADLNDLRLALGYETWNVWGISYGTRLAQTVMRDHPEGVRSVVLDSTYPLAANLLTDTPDNVIRAFTVFFAGCAADTVCHEAYPDLETVFYEQITRLDEEPVILPVTNVLTGESYEAYFRGTDLVGVLFQTLYATEIIPVLPQMIYDIAAEDYSLLTTLLSSFLANAEFISIGMQYSVQCYEENSFATREEVEAAASEYPLLEPFFAYSINIGPQALTVCEQWGAGEADDIENENISSDIPTLILSGEYDPITPPAWGQEVATGLENSYFYQFPGVGHGASLAGACPVSVMEAFWAEPMAEPAAACLAEMTGPQFVQGNAAADITLVPFTSETFGITGVIPEGWTESSPGVHVRGNSALDGTVIIQQAVPGVSADDLLQLLTGQLGLTDAPTSTETVELGTYTWVFYQTEASGGMVDFALTESDGTTIIVVLFSSAEERQTLIDQVFMPVLEAIQIQS